MLQVQSENPMVERGSIWTTHFKFGLMVVTWSIPSGLAGSRIIRTISQSARKWRLMAETGTTQFAQWNDRLFVRKKIRKGKRISTLPPSHIFVFGLGFIVNFVRLLPSQPIPWGFRELHGCPIQECKGQQTFSLFLSFFSKFRCDHNLPHTLNMAICR